MILATERVGNAFCLRSCVKKHIALFLISQSWLLWLAEIRDMILRHRVCPTSLQSGYWYLLSPQSWSWEWRAWIRELLATLCSGSRFQPLTDDLKNHIVSQGFLGSSFRHAWYFWPGTGDEYLSRERELQRRAEARGWTECLWAQLSGKSLPRSACCPWPVSGHREPVICLSRLEMDLPSPESTWT